MIYLLLEILEEFEIVLHHLVFRAQVLTRFGMTGVDGED